MVASNLLDGEGRFSKMGLVTIKVKEAYIYHLNLVYKSRNVLVGGTAEDYADALIHTMKYLMHTARLRIYGKITMHPIKATQKPKAYYLKIHANRALMSNIMNWSGGIVDWSNASRAVFAADFPLRFPLPLPKRKGLMFDV